jgi:hypothetical protein
MSVVHHRKGSESAVKGSRTRPIALLFILLAAAGSIFLTAGPSSASTAHELHVLHVAHLRVLAEHRAVTTTAASSAVGYATHYSYSGLESLWIGAGGPASVAAHAASIAECESGGYVYAHNPSGASGLWQILGLPFAGNPFNPYTNARMAVSKFRSAGGSFAPWVCR